MELYTYSFRQSFLKMLCDSNIYYSMFIPYLKRDWFNEYQFKFIFDAINSIRKSYPTKNTIIQSELDSEIISILIDKEEDIVNSVLAEAKKIFNIKNIDYEVIINSAKEWIIRQRLVTTLKETADCLISKQSLDINKIRLDIEKAVSVSVVQNDYLKNDCLFNVINAVKEERSCLVSTGFPTLDDCLSGGYGSGEIHIVLGGAKVGKSSFCVQLLCNAIKEGKNVVYITLELSKLLVSYKIACCLTDMTYDQILADKEMYQRRLKTVMPFLTGKFIIQEFLPKTTTTNEIYSYLLGILNLEQMKQIDLLIIDYDDLLMPLNKKVKTDYEKAEQIYLDLFNLSKMLKCPIITPAQCNRDGWKKSEEGEILTSQHLAKSAAKKMYCHSIITLNYDCDNEYTIYVDTVRFGRQHIDFKIEVDLEKNKFFEK